MSKLSNEVMQVQFNISKTQSSGIFTVVKITEVLVFLKYLIIISHF